MRRLLFNIVAATTTGLAAVAACGGEVFGNPIGYLDDGGVFHSPDGAVVFGPGSACPGYDSAAFASLGSSEPCSTDQECADWFRAHAPSNYTWNAKCTQGIETTAKTCTADFVNEVATVNTGAGVSCTPGAEGDAYCTAMYGQFLLGDARVSSTCTHLCKMHIPEQGPPYCESGTDVYKCSTGRPGESCTCDDTPLANLELCVERGDGGEHCEVPCAAPPADGTIDAGSDSDAFLADDGGGADL